MYLAGPAVRVLHFFWLGSLSFHEAGSTFLTLPRRGLNLKSCVLPIFLQEPITSKIRSSTQLSQQSMTMTITSRKQKQKQREFSEENDKYCFIQELVKQQNVHHSQAASEAGASNGLIGRWGRPSRGVLVAALSHYHTKEILRELQILPPSKSFVGHQIEFYWRKCQHKLLPKTKT